MTLELEYEKPLDWPFFLRYLGARRTLTLSQAAIGLF